jgi:uncharacterized protein YdhG (YjbR/CyaY superfamily)
MKGKPPANIDQYISGCPRDVQARLGELRELIRKAAPKAEERISYGMPAFFQDGILVYFMAHARHIGFYPTARGIEHFEKELGAFATSKGTVQFPHDKPLPKGLVTKIVKFRIKDNAERTSARAKPRGA